VFRQQLAKPSASGSHTSNTSMYVYRATMYLLYYKRGLSLRPRRKPQDWEGFIAIPFRPYALGPSIGVLSGKRSIPESRDVSELFQLQRSDVTKVICVAHPGTYS
jgi:hypothetical protein